MKQSSKLNRNLVLAGGFALLTTAIAMSQSGFSHGNPTRASEEGILVVDLNKECWYDLDGDGKREFYQSNVYVGNRRYKGLFRLNEECNLANYIIDSYRNLGSDYRAQNEACKVGDGGVE